MNKFIEVRKNCWVRQNRIVGIFWTREVKPRLLVAALDSEGDYQVDDEYQPAVLALVLESAQQPAAGSGGLKGDWLARYPKREHIEMGEVEASEGGNDSRDMAVHVIDSPQPAPAEATSKLYVLAPSMSDSIRTVYFHVTPAQVRAEYERLFGKKAADG